MKRSKVIALLNAIEVPGEDDPEVRFEHPEWPKNGSALRSIEAHNGVIMLRETDPVGIFKEPEQKLLTLAERDALHKDNGAVSFLYRPNNPDSISFGQLILFIEELLQPMTSERLDNHLVAICTEKMTDMIQTMYANKKFCMPFDGARITAGKALKKASDVIVLEFITEWMPHARYDNADPSWMPLGFLREFDLYYAVQNGLPPTLVIKDGHKAEEYVSYNPFLIDTLPGLEMYRVALQRAAMINHQFAERYQQLVG